MVYCMKRVVLVSHSMIVENLAKQISPFFFGHFFVAELFLKRDISKIQTLKELWPCIAINSTRGRTIT